MAANMENDGKVAISYDPATFGYSPVNEAPEINERHKPGAVYFSDEIQKREIEEIFMKQWLIAGRAEEVEQPGDYFTLRIADEPIVVVKEKDCNVQAFANVCRHRGVQVAWHSGNTKYFSCPYHGWVYDTSGRLVEAQYLEKSKNFKKENCRLPLIRTELWEGFIFINFDAQARPLMEYLDEWDFPKIYGPYQMGRLRLANKFELNIGCNWKFLNENLTDHYHTAVLHAETFGPHQRLEDLPLPNVRRWFSQSLHRRDARARGQIAVRSDALVARGTPQRWLRQPPAAEHSVVPAIRLRIDQHQLADRDGQEPVDHLSVVPAGTFQPARFPRESAAIRGLLPGLHGRGRGYDRCPAAGHEIALLRARTRVVFRSRPPEYHQAQRG